MFPVITHSMFHPTKLNAGRFLNIIGLYVSILSFVDITNGGCSLTFFISSECSSKYTSVDAFYI